jgi:hypothetical protein
MSQKCSELLSKMKSLELTPLSCNVLKTTDAGPGVGVSNTEVRFRDIEIATIHSSDRVNRIHRAPGDSGQNESERSNAAIGNALVDGAALKWRYFEPLDGLPSDEVDNLTITELTNMEEECKRSKADY